jgi:hypothetical protein
MLSGATVTFCTYSEWVEEGRLRKKESKQPIKHVTTLAHELL